MIPQAVIFDLDDTLYAERSYAFSGFAAVATAFVDRLGEPSEATALMRQLFDTEHRARVFDEVLRRKGVADAPALIALMVTTFRTHHPTIQLLDDADAALTYWRAHARTGIISDGPAVMQRAKVDALGLAGRVDQILLTDEWGPDFAKPSTKAFEMIAGRLDAAHAHCVYVADNPAKDFGGPNILGWRTVRVVRADGVYRDHAVAQGGAPQCIVTSLAELSDVLT